MMPIKRRTKPTDRIRSDRSISENVGAQFHEGDSHRGEGQLTSQPLDMIRPNPNNPRKLPFNKDRCQELAHMARERIGLKTENAPTDEVVSELRTVIDQEASDQERPALERLLMLAHSIHYDTLIQPVVIEGPNPETGGYTLIAGERRFLAHHLLGRSYIRAMLRHLSSDAKRSRQLALAENLAREELTLRERVAAIEELMQIYEQETGKKPFGTVVSRMINENERTTQRYMKLVAASPSVRDQIDNGGVATLNEALSLVENAGEGKEDKEPRSTPGQASPDHAKNRAFRVALGTINDVDTMKRLIARVSPEGLDGLEGIEWDDPKAVQVEWKRLLKNISEAPE